MPTATAVCHICGCSRPLKKLRFVWEPDKNHNIVRFFYCKKWCPNVNSKVKAFVFGVYNNTLDSAQPILYDVMDITRID